MRVDIKDYLELPYISSRIDSYLPYFSHNFPLPAPA